MPNFITRGNPGTVIAGAGNQVPNTRYGTGGQTAQDAPFHPHPVDFYIPNGTLTVSMTLLHGGGATNTDVAQQFLVLGGSGAKVSTNVRWTILAAFNCVLAVPQGQCCRTTNVGPWNPATTYFPAGYNSISTQNPLGIPAFSNWFTWSGADDMQFLKDLATYIQTTWGILSAKIIAGHSDGGMMAQRLWYEAPSSYQRYAVVSGPAMTHFQGATLPAYIAPMWAQYGLLDTNLGINGGWTGANNHFYEAVWQQQPFHLFGGNVAYPYLNSFIGDFTQLQTRVTAIGSVEVVTQSGAVVTAAKNHASATVSTWTYASGNMVMKLVSDAGHDTKTQQQSDGLLILKILRWATGR